MTQIEIVNSKLVDLTTLKAKTNVTYLNLSRNSISSCIPLKDLTNLTYLNLQNNAITDVSWENGVSYNNLKILADLNKNSGKGGKLEKLYLSGNSGIADFSPVKSLSWAARSGF